MGHDITEYSKQGRARQGITWAEHKKAWGYIETYNLVNQGVLSWENLGATRADNILPPHIITEFKIIRSIYNEAHAAKGK